MIVQFVKLESALPEEELLSIAHDRAPQFRALPGLIQKYYVQLGEPGRYGGIYIWDSQESLDAFRQSELAATIPSAYKVMSKPDIEILQGMFQLRDES